MTKTAKQVGLEKLSMSGAVKRLYKLSHPVEYRGASGERGTTKYVCVSALTMAFDTLQPETLIFPAREDGTILDWLDLRGSYQGGTDHAEALKRAGYKVK